jgi:hypothetical protein
MESRIQNTLKITFNDENNFDQLITLNRINNLVYYIEQLQNGNKIHIDLSRFSHYVRNENKIEIINIDINSICILVKPISEVWNCIAELLTTNINEYDSYDHLLRKYFKQETINENLIKIIVLLRQGVKIFANIC